MTRRVVVLGGGVTGWTAAGWLARTLKPLGGAVRLVELEDDAREPGTLSTLPSAPAFLRALGLAEDPAVRSAKGTFKLGASLEGWSGPTGSAFVPFGQTGAMLGSVAFHHFLIRTGRTAALGDYALAALAARDGRFARPSGDPRSVLSTLEYGLHLERRGYAGALRRHAEQFGVIGVRGELAAVDVADGLIGAVRLTSGERVEAELFIDCSGPKGLLIGEALGEPAHAWDVPFDRAIEATRPTAEPPAPFTRRVADAEGWLEITPLQGALGLRQVYSSAHLGDEAAAGRLRVAGAADPSTPRALSFARRETAWRGNVVAIGGAAAALGPFAGAELQLAQSALARLIELFPHGQRDAASAAAYNRATAAEAEQMRDLLQVPFKLNGRHGDPAWDLCRDAPVSEALHHKLRLFESRGRTPLLEQEPCPEGAWTSVLLAMGLHPRRHDALADAMEPAKLDDILGRMRAAMTQAVQAMPRHSDFIAARCAAAQPELAS